MVRGTKAKALKKYAFKIWTWALSNGQEKYAMAGYMQHPRHQQLMCAGQRGFYRILKKMYRNNEDITGGGYENSAGVVDTHSEHSSSALPLREDVRAEVRQEPSVVPTV